MPSRRFAILHSPWFLCRSRMLAALLLATALVAAPASARAQQGVADPTEPERIPTRDVTGGEIVPGGDTLGPGEGEIYNLTDRPFTFRLHRRHGPTWTPYYTLQPGMRFVGTPQQRDELLGITGNGKGYVIVQYPELNGNITLRLPARVPSTGEVEPTWFCVFDSSGIHRLVQAKNADAARAIQSELQKDPPMTPEQIARMKFTYKANWVYDERGNRNTGSSWGAFGCPCAW